MLKSLLLAAAGGTAFVCLGLSAPAAIAAQASGEPDTLLERITVLDRYVSTENGAGLDRFRWDQRNWYDFDILTAAVVADGNLVSAVTDPHAALTLFAPNDRAFQLLAYDLTGNWYWTEEGVLNAIVGAVQVGAVDLTNVLTYHVLDGRVNRADVPFFTPVPTLNGDTILFNPRFFGLFVELQDNVGAFRNPYLIRTDLDAGNSVIHSISRVLIPTNVGGGE